MSSILEKAQAKYDEHLELDPENLVDIIGIYRNTIEILGNHDLGKEGDELRWETHHLLSGFCQIFGHIENCLPSIFWMRKQVRSNNATEKQAEDAYGSMMSFIEYLPEFTGFSLDAADKYIEELKLDTNRYAENEFYFTGYLAYFYKQTGNLEKYQVQQEIAAKLTIPLHEDGCETCYLTSLVRAYNGLGNKKEAEERTLPLVDGTYDSCLSSPRIPARILLWLSIEEQDWEKAAFYVEVLNDNMITSMMPAIDTELPMFIVYASTCQDKCLQYLNQYGRVVSESKMMIRRFHFFKAASIYMDYLAKQTEREYISLSFPVAIEKFEKGYKTAGLAIYFKELAKAAMVQLDTRNGNDYYQKQFELSF